MNTAPLISVIVPMFNAQDFIEETIKSVQSQTYENWELLIIDNCSTDTSREVVSRHLQKDARIRLVVSEYNSGGPARPRNIGIKHARGKYIAFLDSDDLWNKTKLEKQVVFLEAEPSIFMLFSKYSILYPERIVEYNPKFDPRNMFRSLFLSNNFIGCLTVIFRNRWQGNQYFFDENRKLIAIEDFDLWLRIAKEEKIGFIDESLSIYRVRSSKSLSNEKHDFTFRHLRLVNKWRHQVTAGLLLRKFYSIIVSAFFQGQGSLIYKKLCLFLDE